MAYSRSSVVNQAKAWLGKKESNGSHKEIIDIYNDHKPLARGYKMKYTDSWCAAFVSAVAIKCGYTAIIPTECGCGQMIELFKGLGEWQENDAYKPSAGDVIFYDWDDSGSGDNTGWPDHVGIVEKVSGNTITVIEGNKGDAVARREIQANGVTIRGYGVPKYNGSGIGSSSSSGAGASSTSNGTYSGGKSANYKVKINTPSGVNVRKGPAEDKYAKFDAIENGKTVTITKVSGNWGYAKEYGGWICLDYTKKVTTGSSSSSSGSSKPSYKTGSTYTVNVDALTVRTGAGTNYKAKTKSQLTADGRKHANGNGCLVKGTRVTCQATKNVGSDIWMKIPSGWIAAYYSGKAYVK